MPHCIRAGRIAGVPVGLHWTLVFVVALVSWGLAASRFPERYQGHAVGTYWIAGGSAALLFLLSVLAHEVAHAVVARRRGLEVEELTLWGLGGLTKMAGEADDPGTELRVAGAGPLVSAALAGLALAFALLLDAFRAPVIAAGTLRWVALVNAMLAVFNLVPALPMDGGRILRAVLWRLHGDRARAALTSARAGRIFGNMLLVFGILQLLNGSGLGGLWTAAVGWFVLRGAMGEERRVVLEGAFSGLRIADVMTPDLLGEPEWRTVSEVVAGADPRRATTFPVVSWAGTASGMVTLARLAAVPVRDRDEVRLRDVAAPLDTLPVAREDDLVIDALRAAGRQPGRGLAPGWMLVVDDGGRLRGTVSPATLAAALEWRRLAAPAPAAQVRAGDDRRPASSTAR